MKRAWLVMIALTLLAAEKKKKPEPYNPHNLPGGEVACGYRGDTSPCHCMEHRAIKRESLLAECDTIADKKKRMICWTAVPNCPTVIDQEHSYEAPEGMPVQCKHTCHTARCQCCAT